MPAGQHSICATVNGKPGRRVVNVDKAAYERLQADLAEHLRASAAGEKARPMLMFDHAAGNAAAKPLGFEWDDERGILLRVEWTQAGREAVEGGNYGYVSPAFRLAKGTGQILGLAGGVEVGSLVNDPAFERNECIAASRTDEPEEVQVDYVETANPYGCNQYGEGWRMPHRGIRSKTKAQEKTESERLEKVRADAEKLLEEYKEVSALWSGNELGRKAAQMNKLHLIREIWNSMNSAADAIKKRLEGKGLTESEEKYFRDYMSDLEKQMKRAQKWARTINSKTQNEELRAAFAELEKEQQEEYVSARNVWGCNQYGHREGHEGAETGEKKRKYIMLPTSPELQPEWLKKLVAKTEKEEKERENLSYDARKWGLGGWAWQTNEEPPPEVKRLQEKIRKAIEERDKNFLSQVENISSSCSVPPREEVEKNTLMGENKNVAKQGGANNQKQNMEEIKKMLGLPAEADEAAVLSAIRSLKAQGAEAKTKTEEVAAECEKHKKALAEHKEKSADAFIKRLQKDGTIAPKDEEKAKAARTLYMADPEQAEIMLCGLRAVHSDVLEDAVHANRVTATDGDIANKSLEELLNEN